jgi:hypothetical protein
MKVSINLDALAKEQLRAIADVVSGRITPAEANARAAEARKVLKAAKLAIKASQMSRLGIEA